LAIGTLILTTPTQTAAVTYVVIVLSTL
jgi:hypothetical protein